MNKYQDFFVDGKFNRIEFYNDRDLLHRDNDLPAVIHVWNGTKEYWVNGRRHRDGDKPAIQYHNGSMEYFKDGERHRDDDKPAVILIHLDKTKLIYYKNGVQYIPKGDIS